MRAKKTNCCNVRVVVLFFPDEADVLASICKDKRMSVSSYLRGLFVDTDEYKVYNKIIKYKTYENSGGTEKNKM